MKKKIELIEDFDKHLGWLHALINSNFANKHKSHAYT